MVRVLSYPPVHDYVDRLEGSVCHLVHRDECWPALPNFYRPGWLREHEEDWDITHFHFTWEQYSPHRLAEVLRTHRHQGKKVVWTVHDIQNPHTPETDERYMHALAQAADVVTSPTPGAGEEVERMIGRRPITIPHGPFLDAPTIRSVRSPGRPWRGKKVLLFHLRSGRANMKWRPWLQVVTEMAREGWGLVAKVCAHADHPERDALHAWGEQPGCLVSIHKPLSLPQLVQVLQDADALTLPYAWGTHSGLAELAADVGTPIIVGAVGYVREQVPVISVQMSSGAPDSSSLRSALMSFCRGRTPRVPTLEDRNGDLEAFIQGHRQIYSDLLSS